MVTVDSDTRSTIKVCSYRSPIKLDFCFLSINEHTAFKHVVCLHCRKASGFCSTIALIFPGIDIYLIIFAELCCYIGDSFLFDLGLSFVLFVWAIFCHMSFTITSKAGSFLSLFLFFLVELLSLLNFFFVFLSGFWWVDSLGCLS